MANRCIENLLPHVSSRRPKQKPANSFSARSNWTIIQIGFSILLHDSRRRRIADMLEKLGVAGVAVGIFQGSISGMISAIIFCIASYF